MIDLGYKPNQGKLILSEGADWVCTFTEENAVWPEGTTCRLEFPDLSGVGPFAAVVIEENATASFVLQETATTAASIPSGSKFRIYLTKENDFLWFYGKVARAE